MDCLETREKLSSYADGELADGDGRQGVAAHLEQCAECRHDLECQGALDMLLKDHFKPVPPEGYFDRFWPRVEQRVEGEPPGGGARSKSDEELVFKSSPALQALNIPDRRPREPEVPPEVQVGVVQPVAPPPEAEISYRWPVAFVLAAAVVTGGFLIHKKMNPPPPDLTPRAATISGAGWQERAGEPASQPAAGVDATVLAAAAAATDDAAAADPAIGSEAAEPDQDREGDRLAANPDRRHRRSARRGSKRSRARAAGEGDQAPDPAAATETAAAAAAKPARPQPAVAGKAGDLDSLIDKAIGGRPAAQPEPAPAKSADSSLPDQLTMNQIQSRMRKISGKVQACYDKFQIEGKAMVRLTITREGQVKDVLIKGKFFGTDTGACVAAAVKSAQFPKFAGNEMTISYPFILQ